MSAPATCIAIRGVSKTYERPGRRDQAFTALTNVSLDIAEGEFISLIGASGCGKTTLLRMISGLIPASTGEVVINGRRVDGVPDRIGFVFQEPRCRRGGPYATTWPSSSSARGCRPSRSRRPSTTSCGSPTFRTSSATTRRPCPAACSSASAWPGRSSGILTSCSWTSPCRHWTRSPGAGCRRTSPGILGATGTTTILVTHDVDEAVFFSDRIVVMGTSPGSVREIVNVPLGRPRHHADIIGNPEAAKVRDHVLSLVLDLHQ